jgi:acetoin utilization deacetylase AcuC-like enzyme
LLKRGAVEDPDTPAYEKIYEYARLSAGGAILAAKINGFSLMRPPGHHAGRYAVQL